MCAAQFPISDVEESGHCVFGMVLVIPFSQKGDKEPNRAQIFWSFPSSRMCTFCQVRTKISKGTFTTISRDGVSNRQAQNLVKILFVLSFIRSPTPAKWFGRTSICISALSLFISLILLDLCSLFRDAYDHILDRCITASDATRVYIYHCGECETEVLYEGDSMTARQLWVYHEYAILSSVSSLSPVIHNN